MERVREREREERERQKKESSDEIRKGCTLIIISMSFRWGPGIRLPVCQLRLAERVYRDADFGTTLDRKACDDFV